MSRYLKLIISLYLAGSCLSCRRSPSAAPGSRNEEPPKAAGERTRSPAAPDSLASRTFLSKRLDSVAPGKKLEQLYGEVFADLSNADSRDLRSLAEALVSDAIDGSSRGKLPPEFGQKIVVELSRRDPFLAWELWQKNFAARPFPPGTRDGFEIVASMAAADPRQTINLVRAASAEPGLLTTAFQTYLSSDQNDAGEWFEANRNSLSGTEQEALHLAEFSALASSGQVQKAMQALEQVSDPALMLLRKDEIDAARKARALELAESRPNEAMDYAVKTASGGGNPEMIQAVASEWLSKDPDAAFDWFQKATGLSSDQADQISRSFVEACLLQSDTATARMWADSIRNARVREDLNDAIGAKSQTPKR